jgi:ubiquinone/menaquinone biosynthesis C-methylase UbiE
MSLLERHAREGNPVMTVEHYRIDGTHRDMKEHKVMATPADPRHEFGGTYVVQDHENRQELTRLQIQDQMFTASMGGVLPEQPDPGRFRRVLDVGCGTGGWLIEVARTYPGIEYLVGIDVSRQMIAYARKEAQNQQVDDRVEFRLMDALQMLEFPNDFFDLVNHRFAASWLRTWDWPKLLQEYRRVTCPGGVIRLTEADADIQSSSSALMRLHGLLLEAFYRSGHYFTPMPDGVTSQLDRLLHQFGIENVQTQRYILHYRAGTEEGEQFAQDMRLGFRTGEPYLRKWSQVPDDYEALYQQMLQEMEQPDFFVQSRLLTAWGTRPQPRTKRVPGREVS